MSFRFRKFKVYQEAIEFHRFIVFITKKFTTDFDYLKNQIRRSSLSIVLNIAEGSAKNSDRDFNRYLGNSLGSANETMAGCEVAYKQHLITEKEFCEAEERSLSIANQLGGFSKRLRQMK